MSKDAKSAGERHASSDNTQTREQPALQAAHARREKHSAAPEYHHTPTRPANSPAANRNPQTRSENRPTRIAPGPFLTTSSLLVAIGLEDALGKPVSSGSEILGGDRGGSRHAARGQSAGGSSGSPPGLSPEAA